MVTRYFVNPTRWRCADGGFSKVIEVGEGATAFVHNLTTGTVDRWEYAGLYIGRAALDRALAAVERGSWVELSFNEAFPSRSPQTEYDGGAW